MNRSPLHVRKAVTSILGATLVVASLASAAGAPKGKKKKPAAKPCVATLAKCPLKGCGGDGLLNALKNSEEKPSNADPMTLAAIVALNSQSPHSWSSGSARDDLTALGEGKGIEVKGWLIAAHVTGTPETCNCKLKGTDNNDFHLNLVPTKKSLIKRSVVIEMSPRSRDEGWTLPKVKALADQKTYVRVTGFLMFDSQHAAFQSMPRATAWEVHPVTKFEVCTQTQAKCDQGTGWKPLESLQ